MHASHLARFGEPVELATGTVSGILDLEGMPFESRSQGSEVGARLGLDHQAQPILWLRTEDAAGLLEGASVGLRGIDYLVVRLDPDGAGMTRVELMRPGAEPQPRPEWRQWR
ncbi:MAG: hypothetical protein MUC79_16035 [Thiobacillaceae bacterium]|jgi:hypothetical protein|nr:hypothetical protein [Thiobacillaceae bacterium]